MSYVDVALFPIPNCVSFPGMVYPLHVFEPRYRAMVNHCIETDTWMAVCHTQKELRPAKTQQSVEEALHSNQATYQPYEVFSAGSCELKQVFEDGRMLINVHLKKRFKAILPKQAVPFTVYSCEEFTDDALNAQQRDELVILQDKINHRLLAITRGNPDIQALLNSEHWRSKSAEALSFDLFSVLQLDAELLQDILEQPSPVARLQKALDALNRVS